MNYRTLVINPRSELVDTSRIYPPVGRTNGGRIWWRRGDDTRMENIVSSHGYSTCVWRKQIRQHPIYDNEATGHRHHQLSTFSHVFDRHLPMGSNFVSASINNSILISVVP